MRVYIDTTKPDIQLRPIRSAADKKVGVSWTIDETYPKLATMQLKLRTSKDPTWHELKAPQAIEGKMEWPTDPGDDYIVQLTLEDRAGNAATKTLDVAGILRSDVEDAGAARQDGSARRTEAADGETGRRPRRPLGTAGAANGEDADRTGSAGPARDEVAAENGFERSRTAAHVALAADVDAGFQHRHGRAAQFEHLRSRADRHGAAEADRRR